jgi:hypothetical protein
MEHNMSHYLAALVVTGGLIAVIGVSHGLPTAPVELAQPLGLFGWLDGLLDAIQAFIERLDELLEAIVDLLETLNDLFGGEEGGD